jgi:Flp pilus assembly pilin Flp
LPEGIYMRNILKRLWHQQSGQDAAEYALLAVMLALVVVAILYSFGGANAHVFDSATTTVGSSVGGGNGGGGSAGGSGGGSGQGGGGGGQHGSGGQGGSGSGGNGGGSGSGGDSGGSGGSGGGGGQKQQPPIGVGGN